MTVRLIPLCLCGVLLAHSGGSGADPVVVPKKVAGAQLVLTKHLDALDLPRGWIRYLNDERLARDFPGYYFFQVRYAAGSARRLTGGLEETNVFAVDPEGKVRALRDKGELFPLFRDRFTSVTTERAAGQAARTFAMLVVAWHPGYVFGPADVKVTNNPAGGLAVIARRTVKQGGTGHVQVEMRFGPKGRLSYISRNASLIREKRVVRTAALVKRATKIATDELVRIKVPASTLKQVSFEEVQTAFPGYVFFSYLGDQEKAGKWVARGLVVVEADGQAVLLPSIGDVSAYVRAIYDPITSDEQARRAMHLFLRLLTAVYAEVMFRPLAETFAVEGDPRGGRTITGRLEAETGRGFIYVVWRFGKLGRVNREGIAVRPGGKP
jgi:hypothetical protein